MTLYDLTRAIGRHKRFLIISIALLLIGVVVLSFTFEDGGVEWRGSQKYQVDFQISVVTPATTTLSESDLNTGVRSAAGTYADLLSSAEAAAAVGEAIGVELTEPLSAFLSSDSDNVISAYVIVPNTDVAEPAIQAAFDWLAVKIEQPLDAQPPVTPTVPSTGVTLDGPFPSTLEVVIDPSLSSVEDDVLALIDVALAQRVAIPVAERAGTTITSSATFEPGGSVTLNLETSGGLPYDLLRVVPEPLPPSAPAYPSLTITLGPGSIERGVDAEENPIWQFDAAAITTEWVAQTPSTEVEVIQPTVFQVALLTDVPSALQIGGRRGPLIGAAVLFVGLIILLTIVIIADAWRRERDAATLPSSSPLDRMPTDAVTGRAKARTVDPKVAEGVDAGADGKPDPMAEADKLSVEILEDRSAPGEDADTPVK